MTIVAIYDSANMTRHFSDKQTVGEPIGRRPALTSKMISAKFFSLSAEKDEFAAKSLFDDVEPALRRFAKSCLRSKGIQARDVEDIAQDAINEIWRYRAKIEAQTAAEWWKFVRKVVERKCSKHFQKEKGKQEVSIDDFIDSQALGDHPFPRLLDRTLKGQILDVADRVWLQSRPSSAMHSAELPNYLAQQYCFEGKSIYDVMQMAQSLHFSSESEFSRWIYRNTNFASAIYKYLYFSPTQLSCYLLDFDQPEKLSDFVQTIIDSERESDGCIAKEASVSALIVVERFFFCEPVSRVFARYGSCIPSEMLQREYSEIRARLPFAQRAANVYRHALQMKEDQPIDFKGICKRLALQYHAIDHLHPEQIIELISDIGDVFNCRITESILSNWLSRGRLYEELERHIGEAI